MSRHGSSGERQPVERVRHPGRRVRGSGGSHRVALAPGTSSARSATTTSAPCSRSASAPAPRSTPTTAAKAPAAPGLDAGQRVLDHDGPPVRDPEGVGGVLVGVGSRLAGQPRAPWRPRRRRPSRSGRADRRHAARPERWPSSTRWPSGCRGPPARRAGLERPGERRDTVARQHLPEREVLAVAEPADRLGPGTVRRVAPGQLDPARGEQRRDSLVAGLAVDVREVVLLGVRRDVVAGRGTAVNISAQACMWTSAVGVITPSRSNSTASTASQSRWSASVGTSPRVGAADATCREGIRLVSCGDRSVAWLDEAMPEPVPDRPLSRELLARAPKVLLHDHLDGGPAAADRPRARRRDRSSAAGRRRRGRCGAGSRRPPAPASLERYLETFEHTVAVMQTAAQLRRVARECVLDLAEDGVVYAEVRYAPEQHLHGGLSPEQVVEAVRDGIVEGQEEARRDGRQIVVRQLLTAMRHQARSREIAELTIGLPQPGRRRLRHRRRRGGLPADPAPRRVRVPPAGERALHHPRRRGVRAAVDLAGDPVVRRRPARARRADHRRHHGRRRRHADARPARVLRAGQADPARDVPVLEHPDRGRRVDRRAPDRHADPAAVPGDRQHRQPADERHLDERRDGPAGRRVRLRHGRPALVHRSTR